MRTYAHIFIPAHLCSPPTHPPTLTRTQNLMLGGGGGEGGGKTVCPVCCPGSSATIERVALPYVFRFLAAELAAMNIKMELEIK